MLHCDLCNAWIALVATLSQSICLWATSRSIPVEFVACSRIIDINREEPSHPHTSHLVRVRQIFLTLDPGLTLQRRSYDTAINLQFSNVCTLGGP